MIFKRTAAGLLELLEVTDLAAEVTKTNALIDCFTSNAVRRVFGTFKIHHNEARIELPRRHRRTDGCRQTSEM